jgi:AraC-like DNA-binding protein
MIAGCIEKMRHDACGGCERKDACANLFSGLFGRRGAFASRMQREPARPSPSGAAPFLAFLGRVAGAIEEGARRPAAARKPRSVLGREVERRLEPMLAGGTIRIAEIARDLGLSRQTLYRRLKAEGVTFEEVLDGLRRRLALRHIREEGLSVKETAYRLGFSDPAAFSRAFKRWTGRPPSEMRP